MQRQQTKEKCSHAALTSYHQMVEKSEKSNY